MTRFTKFNEELGRYVVPLLRHEDGTPIAGIVTLHPEERDITGQVILSPQLDALFGEVVDRLAELELWEEFREKSLNAIREEFDLQPITPTTTNPPKKRGRWQYRHRRAMVCHTTGVFLCSHCGHGWERLEGQRLPKFCPNCGADMRKEDEG